MGPSNWAYTFPLAALTAALLADAAWLRGAACASG
jgi:tellurite resistance protein TehA-like permease